MSATDNSLSQKEMETLALAWQCFDSEPKVRLPKQHMCSQYQSCSPLTTTQVDTKKLAALTGYTVGSAGVTLGKIKRKLKNMSAAVTGEAVTPTSTPRKTPKSGGKRAAANTNDDDTPSKKPRSNKKKARTPEPDDDDEEFRKVHVKNEEVADLLQGADAFFNSGYGDFMYQGEGEGGI